VGADAARQLDPRRFVVLEQKTLAAIDGRVRRCNPTPSQFDPTHSRRLEQM